MKIGSWICCIRGNASPRSSADKGRTERVLVADESLVPRRRPLVIPELMESHERLERAAYLDDPIDEHDVNGRLEAWAEGARSADERRRPALALLQKAMAPRNRVAALDLARHGLECLPTDIGRLPGSVKYMLLNENRLSSVPEQMVNLRSLKTLHLQLNTLTEVPENIGALVNLEDLNLASNQIVALPPSIGSMRALKKLDVTENRLESLPMEVSHLNALVTLRAGKNFLSQLPHEMSAMPALRRLDLNNNLLWMIPPQWAPSNAGALLDRLERLDLSHNSIEELPRGMKMPLQLKELDVSFNPGFRTLPPAFCGVVDVSDRSNEKVRTRHRTGNDVHCNPVITCTGSPLFANLRAEGRVIREPGKERRHNAQPLPVVFAAQRPYPEPQPIETVDTLRANHESAVAYHRVADNQMPGGLAGLGAVPQHRGLVIPPPDPAQVDRRMHEWVAPLANDYANRGAPPARMGPVANYWDEAPEPAWPAAPRPDLAMPPGWPPMAPLNPYANPHPNPLAAMLGMQQPAQPIGFMASRQLGAGMYPPGLLQAPQNYPWQFQFAEVNPLARGFFQAPGALPADPAWPVAPPMYRPPQQGLLQQGAEWMRNVGTLLYR